MHSGPLIRAEGIYRNERPETRKRLFNALFNLGRSLPILCLSSVTLKRREFDSLCLIGEISKNISALLKENADFFDGFAEIIIYYDNAQIELTKILTSIFNALFPHIEFRRVRPCDYKLFQLSDLSCTMALLEAKYAKKEFTRSELKFFGGYRTFSKNYLRPFTKKMLWAK